MQSGFWGPKKPGVVPELLPELPDELPLLLPLLLPELLPLLLPELLPLVLPELLPLVLPELPLVLPELLPLVLPELPPLVLPELLPLLLPDELPEPPSSPPGGLLVDVELQAGPAAAHTTTAIARSVNLGFMICVVSRANIASTRSVVGRGVGGSIDWRKSADGAP